MALHPFDFQGFTFTGVRQLSAAEKSDKNPNRAEQIMSHQLPHVTATPVLKDKDNGWDYQAFYEAARAAGAGKMDLFRVQGQGDTLYLPVSNHLFILPQSA